MGFTGDDNFFRGAGGYEVQDTRMSAALNSEATIDPPYILTVIEAESQVKSLNFVQNF